MVAHSRHHILHTHLSIGNHPQRHVLRILVLTHCPRQITVHTLHVAIEEGPHAGVTDTTTTEVWESISVLPRKILVFTGKPSHLACILNHVLRVHHVLLVLQWELADTALVRMSTNGIIRYSPSHPYHTLLRLATVRTTSLHLLNPSLVRVADGKRLTLRVISVSLYKRGHYLDSFTCRFSALQSDVYQRSIVNNSR